MAERKDRIPPIVERNDGVDRAMPITLFDGEATDAILKKENGLIIPEGLKVIFEFGYHPTNGIFESLGTITLGKEFQGAFAARYDKPYLTMPDKSSTVALIPETDDRRALMTELKSLKEHIDPLYQQQGKPNVANRLAVGREREKNINQAVEEIDNRLLQDFLEQRQDDIDLNFFRIDPNTVKKVRIQVALDKKITAEPWPPPHVPIPSHPMVYNPHPAAFE